MTPDSHSHSHSRSRSRSRPVLACGVAGPAAFVAAWVAGGLLRSPEYSPVRQAISQLARTGSSTAPLMTAGFVAFGVLVPVYARGLGSRLGSRPLRAAVTTSGLATLAVAALPLSRSGMQTVDGLHAVAAGTGYVAQALAPLLGAGALCGRARHASYAVSATAAVALAGSVLLPAYAGLLQRTGLTVVDAWLVLVAVHLLRTLDAPAGRGA